MGNEHPLSLPPRRPSGSGKTTLLDILAGRKTVGTIEGQVKFSGDVPTKMFLRRFTGYVEQVGAASMRQSVCSQDCRWRGAVGWQRRL